MKTSPEGPAARPTAALPEAARSAAEAVLESVPPVMRAIRARMREGRAEGISVPQFRAMLFVRRHPGTDLSSVAEHLGASMPSASELVSRLVRDGLMLRTADPASRRRVQLSLSDEGDRQLSEARDRTLDWLAGRLAASTSPEGLGRIDAALRELRSALEASSEA
ncbi:MAG TPA: MarR family transcriptional regulator [Candidatus Limnocylindrales bacterium]